MVFKSYGANNGVNLGSIAPGPRPFSPVASQVVDDEAGPHAFGSLAAVAEAAAAATSWLSLARIALAWCSHDGGVFLRCLLWTP